MDANERKAFEAWAKKNNYRTDKRWINPARNEYMASTTEMMWDAWQARAHLERTDHAEV